METQRRRDAWHIRNKYNSTQYGHAQYNNMYECDVIII